MLVDIVGFFLVGVGMEICILLKKVGIFVGILLY